MTRAQALAGLAASIAQLPSSWPLRIAIDGRIAAGKTILADELADSISREGRPVIRTSIDGFHRPSAERYARGRHSAQGYYYDSRDHEAVIRLLLAPLGPGGNRRYRAASFDLTNDRPLDEQPNLAPADAVLIVDGTFLQRPELREGWDAVIFVKTAKDIAAPRGIARDAASLGGPQAARRLHAERYGPACDLYERLCAPESSADVVFNNDDPERPRVRFRPGGRLAAVSEPG
jgi:uridine kinase